MLALHQQNLLEYRNINWSPNNGCCFIQKYWRKVKRLRSVFENKFLSREFHCINNKSTAPVQRHWHTHTHTLEQHVRKFLKFLQNWLWVGIGQLGKYRDVFVKSTVIFIIKLNKHHTWIYFYHELMPFHCAFSCLMIRSSFLSEQKKIKHCLDQKIWLTYSDPVSLYPH